MICTRPLHPRCCTGWCPYQRNGLSVSEDGEVFTLQMQNVQIIDQPRWPALDSVATPARISFKMVWKSNGEPAACEDATKHFRFSGTHAACQMETSDEAPFCQSWSH